MLYYPNLQYLPRCPGQKPSFKIWLKIDSIFSSKSLKYVFINSLQLFCAGRKNYFEFCFSIKLIIERHATSLAMNQTREFQCLACKWRRGEKFVCESQSYEFDCVSSQIPQARKKKCPITLMLAVSSFALKKTFGLFFSCGIFDVVKSIKDHVFSFLHHSKDNLDKNETTANPKQVLRLFNIQKINPSLLSYLQSF